MAREIITSDYYGSNPLYFYFYSISTNLFWNWNTNAFETFDSLNWAKYASVLSTENDGNGEYFADMPSVSPNGRYFVTICEQAGTDPAQIDIEIAKGELDYSGVKAVSLMGMKLDLWESIQNFGEQIIYKKEDGTQLIRTVLIDRQEPTRLPTVNTVSPSIEITILNDKDYGVDSIIIGGDKISLSPAYGGSSKTFTVRTITKQDNAAWYIRV